jgi:spermidine synthase
MLSLGGAFGGLLVGLAAPNMLAGYFELPLALGWLAFLVLFLVDYRRERLLLAASWGMAAAVLVTGGSYLAAYKESSLVMTRNFYGGLRVNRYDPGTENEARILVHGTVDHGMQFMAPDRRREHITYYGGGSGIGLAMNSLRGSPLQAGVIGLGAGSLAAYADGDDLFRFYEINPLVERIARDHFTYLADCAGTVEVILGDGRLSLERESPRNYDILAVDAFSGDAVPVHLLTKQALELYFRHLKPDGILALHITNTHLDLAPVVENLARALGKQALLVPTVKDEEDAVYSSLWALLMSRPITDPAILEAGQPLPHRPELRTWTDEYNNLFQILK